MSRPSVDRDQSPTIQTEGIAEVDGTRALPLAPQKDGVDSRNLQPRPPDTSDHLRTATGDPSNLPVDQDLFDTSHTSSALKRQDGQPGSPSTLPTKSRPAVEQQADEEADNKADDSGRQLPAHPDPLPADFKPFFTLIADPHTGEHHHPHVHYLFADDTVDEEGSSGQALTAAALDALQPRSDDDEDVEHRVIVVDVAPDGKRVQDAVSLSPAFQALRTEVGPAPSMGGEKEGKEGGMMLRISGEEAGSGQRQDEELGLEGLVGRFGEVVGKLGEVGGGKAEPGRGEEDGKVTGGA